MRQSCLQISEANSGGVVTQKIIEFVCRISVSHEIRETPHSSGLEQALSIPLLEGNRKACVPSIQHANFPPVSSAGDLWVLLSDGVDGIPQETQSLLTPPPEGERERVELVGVHPPNLPREKLCLDH